MPGPGAQVIPAPEAGENLLNAIRFDEQGLVPAVVQQIDTGQAHYFSRSRGFQWHKGEHSGFTQKVVEIRLDCDGDSLLLLVRQNGVACHSGRMSCWYFTVRDGRLAVMTEPEIDPAVMAQESHH